jgi:chemotaxis protein MotB
VVELGKVLGDNPDISVLIEGHTDDDRFSASGPIADNWDLSTKGYAIVAILVKIKASIKLNLPAGRSEFSPLAVMRQRREKRKQKN